MVVWAVELEFYVLKTHTTPYGLYTVADVSGSPQRVFFIL